MISVVNNLPNTVLINDGQSDYTLKKGATATVKNITTLQYNGTTFQNYDMAVVPAPIPAPQRPFIAQLDAYGISDVNKGTFTCMPDQPVTSGIYSTDMQSKVLWSANCSPKSVTITLNGLSGKKSNKKLSTAALVGIIIALVIFTAFGGWLIYMSYKNSF